MGNYKYGSQYGNNKVKFKWNNEGFNEIINSSELQDALVDVMKEVAEAAGPGFEVNAWHSNLGTKKGHGNKGRVAASVHAETNEAKRAEATDKALTKAVQQCRKG